LLAQHGVFDQRFTFGCEDIELGFRLSKHGLRVVYCADAISTMVRGMSLADFCGRLERQGRSNAVFSRLHPDAEIQAWTEVVGAREAWALIAPTVDVLTERASRIDSLFRRKQAAGLETSNEDTEALDHMYWQVCRAHKLKGIVAGLDLL
jgi:GT2 family glycosyltransferase